MIGTHYNQPPDMEKVRTIVNLLGEPRYRNSSDDVLPFEATIIRQVKAAGSSGWPWIEQDYAHVSVIFDRACWSENMRKYAELKLGFQIPEYFVRFCRLFSPLFQLDKNKTLLSMPVYQYL